MIRLLIVLAVIILILLILRSRNKNNYLSSSKFNAQTMCSPLSMQHKTNEVLDSYLKGEIDLKKPENSEPPLHKNFI